MPESADVLSVTRWPGSSSIGPEISVLIPCWHGELTIAGALDSVEAQRGLPAEIEVEIVVVIDGRLQDRQAVCQWVTRKGCDRRWAITLIQLPRNVGPGYARRLGYRHCIGRFLALLDDDDIWHPKKLMLQWGWLVSNPSRISSSHGYGTEVDEKDVSLIELLIGGCCLPTPTLMIRRSLWPFEPEPYSFAEDWLMLAMIASRQSIRRLPENLAWRSALAPPLLEDKYSLTRQRGRLRTGKIKGILILCRRGVLSPVLIPVLVLWNLLLAIRRWLLDRLGGSHANGSAAW